MAYHGNNDDEKSRSFCLHGELGRNLSSDLCGDQYFFFTYLCSTSVWVVFMKTIPFEKLKMNE
ncbi:hypothetical protein BLA29_006948 [Euroglyphus maynei]|uniref:Uncharacterized protein n=1 Tax=Euroglyphus maynei TaxID=6958 RepID=A0A1Y3ARD0_EURMA|nr:hypothetical protein BLA29_006948 [Euroglyphus maynei]